MPRSDSTIPWRRKHDGDNPAVQPAPSLRYYPTTLADLIQIVSDAENQGKEVRASGSHWALSKAAVTDGFAVETQAPEGDPERLNHTLYDVIPACLSAAALEFFTFQGVGPFDPTVDPNVPKEDQIYLYHVEAGTRIYELYSRLDVGDEEQGDSLANQLGFGSTCDYRGPWAMKTLGGAGGQTIVGAFSTGTHGGDIGIGPIADAVQAIHLVGPGDTQYWIERPLPNGASLVDEALLVTRYPNIQVHREEEMLAAVAIAAGRMGIIYSVVLRVIRQYALQETKHAEDWSSVKTWVTNMAAPAFMVPPPSTLPYRFVQIVVNPNGQPDNKSEHTCYVTTRQRVPLNAAGSPPLGRMERSGAAAGHSAQLGKSSSFSTAICSANDWVRAAIEHEISDTNDVRTAALATAAAVVASWVPFLDPGTRASLLQAAAVALGVAVTAKNLLFLLWKLLDEILPPFGSGTFGDEIAALANWCADNDHFEILRRVAEYAFKQDQEEATDTAVSYAVMDIHNYLDVGCSAPGDSIEVFMDAKSPNVINFVDRLLQRVIDLANGILDNGTPRAFAGYLAIRYTADSFALLAMQRFNPTISFEVAGLGRVHGTEPFLRAIEADAVEFGGSLHWGQRNNQKMKTIQEIWKSGGPSGKLFLWRKWLSQLSENGRLHTFSTDFTRERGLEIAQPILVDFVVAKTAVPAFEKTRVMWEATKNPPGTRVLLFIRPAGSTTLGTADFVTTELAGFRDITVSQGQWTFTLAVTLDLNGEVHQDERAIAVRGFAAHDIWLFELTAQCMPVNGALRWAAALSLGSQFISNNLLVEELAGTTGALAKWTARLAGSPDIPFGPASPAHTFTIPQMFNRDWLFFLDTPGCTGTPPVFHLEFKLVSNL